MPVVVDELQKLPADMTRAEGIVGKSLTLDEGREGAALPLLLSPRDSQFFILNCSCSDVQCFIVKPVMNLPPNYKDKPVPEQILK